MFRVRSTSKSFTEPYQIGLSVVNFSRILLQVNSVVGLKSVNNGVFSRTYLISFMLRIICYVNDIRFSGLTIGYVFIENVEKNSYKGDFLRSLVGLDVLI